MNPAVINISSGHDWSSDVTTLLAQADWFGIHNRVAHTISVEDWNSRCKSLGFVGLVSELTVDQVYNNHCKATARDRESEWLNQRKRPDGDRTVNSESPLSRRAAIGTAHAVDCFGLYVSRGSDVLQRQGTLECVPESLWDRPAIFLCPERILSIYPALSSSKRSLRYAPTVTSNPVLALLRLTLLHELGHHFFPIHQSNASHYLTEALANFFVHRTTSVEDQSLLIYKTCLLQSVEYSAYRPLDVLCTLDHDCLTAVSFCFNGDLDGWKSLPAKPNLCIERLAGSQITMALAADAAPCIGLWLNALKNAIPSGNLPLHWDDDNYILWHSRRDAVVPVDLLIDLYSNANLRHWIGDPTLSRHFWGRWGMGDDVRWPEDALHFDKSDLPFMASHYAQSDGTGLSSVICQKMVDVIDANPGLFTMSELEPAKIQATKVLKFVGNDGPNWFDRIPAANLLSVCRVAEAVPLLSENAKKWTLEPELSCAKQTLEFLRIAK